VDFLKQIRLEDLLLSADFFWPYPLCLNVPGCAGKARSVTDLLGVNVSRETPKRGGGRKRLEPKSQTQG
jgi:hypothetical protein